MRDAGRSLSSLRDAHALNEAIELLGKELEVKPATLAPLRRAADRVAAAPAAGAADNPAAAMADAIAQLSPLPDLVEALDLPDDDPAPYVKSLAQSYREARDALRHGFATRRAEDLHEARKRVINWRYQLDLVSPIWPPVIRAEVGELQALRTHLGDHNDLVMLEAAIAAGEPPWSRLTKPEAWTARTGEVRSHLVERAERAASLLFSEPPKRRARRLSDWWTAVRRDGD